MTLNTKERRGDLFAAPSSLLAAIDVALREKPERISIVMDLLKEQDHHETQASYESHLRAMIRLWQKEGAAR
jgi:hypothetical protein